MLSGQSEKTKQNTGTCGSVTPRQNNTVKYLSQWSTQTQHQSLKLHNAPCTYAAEHRRSSWHRQAACGCSPWRRWGYRLLHNQHQEFSSSQSPTIIHNISLLTSANSLTIFLSQVVHPGTPTDNLQDNKTLQLPVTSTSACPILQCFSASISTLSYSPMQHQQPPLWVRSAMYSQQPPKLSPLSCISCQWYSLVAVKLRYNVLPGS